MYILIIKVQILIKILFFLEVLKCFKNILRLMVEKTIIMNQRVVIAKNCLVKIIKPTCYQMINYLFLIKCCHLD